MFFSLLLFCYLPHFPDLGRINAAPLTFCALLKFHPHLVYLFCNAHLKGFRNEGKEANMERNSIYAFQFCKAQLPNGDVELFEDIYKVFSF